MLKKYTKPYPTIGDIIPVKILITFLIVDMTRNGIPRRQPAIILMANSAAALRWQMEK